MTGYGSNMFRQITDHLAEVVWLVDADFERVRYINPAYESLVGRPVGDADEGIETLRAVHPEDREAFVDWVNEIRADVAADAVADEYTLEMRVERSDGDVRWVETVGVPIRNADGEITGVAGISTDFTDRVEREEALKETIERLDQFASMVSHDLRNPLSTALAGLQLYRETDEADHLDAVEESLRRIEAITTDLTALARHGVASGDHEPLSLAAVAHDAWATTDTRQATLDVEDTTVTGDAGQLQGLFENLFRNAVGHGGDDVTVRVAPLSDGDGFHVEDTGSGIPADDRERVFEHGVTTGYGGSGVGLTIVARIARAHGMDVSLDESAEGGARFEFRKDGGDGGDEDDAALLDGGDGDAVEDGLDDV